MAEEKYKFLYEYARGAFDEDLKRFKSIEEKASRFIGLLTILIACYTAIIRFTTHLFFPPDNLIEYITLISIIVTFIGLMSAWYHLFASLRVIHSPRMPLDDNVINLIDNHTLSTSYYTLSKTCKNALNESLIVIEQKTNNLQIAYNDIGMSAWLVTFSLTMLVICKCFK